MVKKDKATDQPSLNSFFKSKPIPTKRNLDEVITLSSDDDDEDVIVASTPQIKRIKSEASSSSSSTALNQTLNTSEPVIKKLSQAAEKVAQFRYDPLASTSNLPLPTAAELTRKKEFAKRLGNVPRRELYLQPEHYLASGNDESRERSNELDEEGDEVEEDSEEEEEQVKGKGKGKASDKGKGKEKEIVATSRFSQFANKDASPTKDKGKGKEKDQVVKWTPLELQVIELKKANPGVILMIEVGYKLRFFGDDALVASRTLNIAQFPSKNFMTASVPVHRESIHLKRLINAGYKVGVVRQIETAALKKVSDNKNKPFIRALTSLTTSATFLDELGGDSLDSGSATATLLCLVEQKKNKDDGKVNIGLLAVMPSTGEVIYDEFEDGFTRSELETRLLHLQPSELVLPKDLSKATESLVMYHVGNDAGIANMTCRTERIKKVLSHQAAYSFVAEFFAKAKKQDNVKNGGSRETIVIDEDSDDDMNENKEEGDPELNKILSLPSPVLIALAALISYLKAFNLDTIFLHTLSFTHFSSRSTMTLNANTIANLEILRNQTDFKEGKGSLLAVIDRCKTGFGRRLLRKWVKRPLVSVDLVNERLDAITEINSSSGSLPIVKLRKLFSGLPDLERGLVRIYFQKITTPKELLRILLAFKTISEVFEPTEEDEDKIDEGTGEKESRSAGTVNSILLKRIVMALPKIKGKIDEFLDELNLDKARDGIMDEMFKPSDKLESLQDAKDHLSSVEYEMEEELHKARLFLKKPKLEFSQVAQEEFLLNLSIAESKKIGIPDNWLRVNATKANYRWRSPGIQKKLQEIEQAREHLANEAKLAFKNYLTLISESYEDLRSAINSVATADCLYSLASLAQADGYCRPEIVSEIGRLDIVEGRSPIVEVLLSAPYVPNSIQLGGDSTRQKLVTGINMGGKSTFCKSVALIALLAQIGSYCPAKSVKTSLFDGIYTRMGASDDLARGRSTFMVEMSETSEILKLATPRSLIILDELGRGTSTYDGLAIAGAVLQHVVTTTKSLCLFVTHYPSLSEVANRYPDSLSVHHMACLEEERPGQSYSDVVFLYKLVNGLASKSHGLNVARLSKLPESVLVRAAEKSKEMEEKIKSRLLHQRAARITALLKTLLVEEVGTELTLELAYNILHQAD